MTKSTILDMLCLNAQRRWAILDFPKDLHIHMISVLNPYGVTTVTGTSTLFISYAHEKPVVQLTAITISYQKLLHL